jgi:hypothetical protein
VRIEVERNLEVRAVKGLVPPARALEVWRERYLSTIRFVSIEGKPVGRAATLLADRHAPDLPTALLAAELLAPRIVAATDDDLVECGIARRDWSTAALNADDAAQLIRSRSRTK